MKKAAPAPCPCGSGKTYAACCEPWHRGAAAPTAEALMRSRYSAYALDLEDYLLETWHPSTRPPGLDLAEEPRPRWIGLEVLRAEESRVEFVARYRINGRAQRLHETSDFRREGDRWYYLAGSFPEGEAR